MTMCICQFEGLGPPCTSPRAPQCHHKCSKTPLDTIDLNDALVLGLPKVTSNFMKFKMIQKNTCRLQREKFQLHI